MIARIYFRNPITGHKDCVDMSNDQLQQGSGFDTPYSLWREKYDKAKATDLILIPKLGEIKKSSIEFIDDSVTGSVSESRGKIKITSRVKHGVFGQEFEITELFDKKTNQYTTLHKKVVRERLNNEERIKWFKSEIQRLRDRFSVTRIPDPRIRKYELMLDKLKS